MSWILGPLAFAVAGMLALAAEPEKPKPQLPDLDVTHIERTPRYPGNLVMYPDDIPTQLLPRAEGERLTREERALLKLGKGYEDLMKTWKIATPEALRKYKQNPEPGETVTFTGHIRNHGPVRAGAFSYAWLIDGKPVGGGQCKGLDPEEEMTTEQKWEWLAGPHTVGLHIQGKPYEEISTENNSVVDRTDAWCFLIGVHRKTYDHFTQKGSFLGTYSFEDWVQAHMKETNKTWEESKYPRAPYGVIGRVRMDRFLILDSEEERKKAWDPHPQGVQGYDGAWWFAESIPWAEAIRKIHDWGLIHELMHQLSLIDNYHLNSGGKARDEQGSIVKLGHTMRQGGVMGGGIRVDSDGNPLPQDKPKWEEHVVCALNSIWRTRGGWFGQYLFDIPKRTHLLVLDNTNSPVAGAKVEVCQEDTKTRCAGPEPKLVGETDRRGLFSLGEEPFGKLHVVGVNALLLLRISMKDHVEFHWMEIFDFNFAYWDGHTGDHTFVVLTGIPPRGAPKPPTVTACQRVPPQGWRLAWGPSPSRDVVEYRVLCNNNGLGAGLERPYRLLMKLPATATETAIQPPPGYNISFRVTAVDGEGRESGYSNEGLATGWAGAHRVAIDPLGRTLVSDGHPHYGLVHVLDQNGNFTRASFGGMGRIAGVRTNGKDRLVVANSYASRVHVLTLAGDEVLAFGKPGKGNGEFNAPEGVAFDSQGCIYAADTGNNRIQVFSPEGKFLRTVPDTSTALSEQQALGVLKTPRAVAVDRKGRIIVADDGNKRLAIFSSSGRFLAAIEGLKDVWDVTVDPQDNIIAADPTACKVLVFGPEGQKIAEYGGEPGKPVSPTAVAIGRKGEIVYIDRVINSLRTITPEQRK
jgi:DNA-binding beta-propeller fold protein YncE